jgi:peptidyl-prolyl cis-trans isomerase D
MRRKKHLKVVLWLVIVGLGLGMLLFFVPGQNLGDGGFSVAAGSVDGDEISMKEFIDAYRRLVNQYSRGSSRLEPATLKMLRLDQSTMEGLIRVRVMKIVAKRLGVEVSPDEIRHAITTNPNFQQKGVFVGTEQYKAVLEANNLTASEFEEGIKDMLLSQKMKNLISDSLIVTDRELREEFQKANQKAEVRFVVLTKEDFKKQATAPESALRAHFEANKAQYAIKEKRRAQYLLISTSLLIPSVTVSESELRDRWAKESHEETVDASHILFPVKDPSEEASAKAKAEAVLKQAKAGADFAELAKKHSGDPSTAPNGGNLGQFGRGRMVKEFQDVAFSLKPGEISNLVRTQFGFHIIKVLQHETPTFASRRPQLEQAVKMEKANQLVKQKAEEAQRLTETQKDLAAVAKALNIPTQIQETPLLAKDADPLASGISQALLDEIFRLKAVGEVGKAVDHPQGSAIPKLLQTELPRPADFSEARPRVEADYLQVRAKEILVAEAKKLSDEAIKLGDLAKAAEKLKLKVKDSVPFKHGDQPDPQIASSPDFNDAAFKLEVGKVSAPITLDPDRFAVLQVKSRTPFDEAEFQKQKPELKTKLLGQLQEAYFEDYIGKVKENLEKGGKIRINQKALEAATGL